MQGENARESRRFSQTDVAAAVPSEEAMQQVEPAVANEGNEHLRHHHHPEVDRSVLSRPLSADIPADRN